MQSRHLDELLLDDREFNPEKFEAKVREQTLNLPKGKRTPTLKEFKDIKTFVAAYREQSPKASKRELRNAIKKYFNIQILPNTK